MPSCSAILLASALLTNVLDTATSVRHDDIGAGFELDGRITFLCPVTRQLLLEDGTGMTSLLLDERIRTRLSCGDRIRIAGALGANNNGFTVACGTEISVLGHGKAPEPADIRIVDAKSGAFDQRLVRTTGTVREVFRDEIDPQWCYFVLEDASSAIYVTMYIGKGRSDLPDTLADTVVSVTGACGLPEYGTRRLFGRALFVSEPEKLKVVKGAPPDPFAVPDAVPLQRTNPEDLLFAGRRRIRGEVRAILDGGETALVRDAGGIHHLIRFASGTPPTRGTFIEASGRQEFDLYTINLSGAIWRPADRTNAIDRIVAPEPLELPVRDIFLDADGQRSIRANLHGQRIRITGTVRDIRSHATRPTAFTLVHDGFTIPVDASSCPDLLDRLDSGFQVGITGICIVNTANWQSYAAFPHTTGVTLAVGDAADVRILARPSWWTPGRLLAAIVILMAALVLIFAWNIMLRRIAERRGRQLFREQVARAGSDMRIEERTRLAVELHDALSQNLTGVALQINAADKMLQKDREQASHHLAIATRTLSSCREELRNCIWDLRNQSLEETDMTEAIRKSVLPHLSGAALAIRFNVPRNRLSDNTAHALMRIVRELVTNAVRHGKAKNVRIAGALDDGRLSFSVVDDGCGFDPTNRPGIEEGHFGLQGIMERIREFDGTVDVASTPGKGTRIAVNLWTRQRS